MEILLLIIFIQIFIESFPVSSSGHVELVEKIMRGASSLSALPDFFDHFFSIAINPFSGNVRHMIARPAGWDGSEAPDIIPIMW